MSSQENIQEVQASKLGDAQGIPSSSIKISGLSRHFVFIVSCTVVLFLELNPKSYYLECTNVANKDCVKFCMKENFQVYGRNE